MKKSEDNTLKWFVLKAMNFGIRKGWGNGYVILPKNHPWYGKSIMELDVDVNGGITFSRKVDDWLVENWNGLIKSDLGKWIVGFDTAHAWNNSADDKEYVEREAERLYQFALEALKKSTSQG